MPNLFKYFAFLFNICQLIKHQQQTVTPGPSWLWSYGSWIYNYLCNQFLSPLMLWVIISIRARYATLCNKVCQWLATGRWFFLDPPVFSTNRTDRHDITGKLLKVALNTINQTNKLLLNLLVIFISKYFTSPSDNTWEELPPAENKNIILINYFPH